MATFQITREQGPDVLILRTEGYINDQGGQRLREECEAALRGNLHKIIIDFEASNLINSVGISNLIAVIERIEETHSRLVFTRLSPTVREIFDTMGLTRFVTICESPDEARANLAAPDTGAPPTPPARPPIS